MKNLITYLSKKSLSLGNGSGMTRKRLGIDSGMTRFSLAILICLCMLTVGVGNAWGAAATLPVDYTLNENSYPTGCSGNSISLQGYAAGNNPYRLKFDGTGDYLQIQVDAAAQQIIFGVKKIGGADNSTFTVKGSSDGSSYTDIEAFSITGAQDAVVNCTTSVSINSSYRYFRFVFTKGANVGFGTLKISKASSCDKKVTITKGTPETGGAFSLDKTGEQNCCSALTVTVSGITAPSGKKFSAITQSGIASGVTIDQSAKTVTYAANSNGSSTINVTFESKGCTDHYGTNVTSGSTQDNKLGPCATYYKYSTRQILYTKTDLNLSVGKKGTIKSISFDYATASDVTRNVTIYMANTSLTSLSNTAGSFVPFSEFTQVYTGSVTFTAGYNEIELSSNYEYNGIGNLVVLIDDNTGSYVTTDYFNTHTASTITGNAQIWTGDDDTNQDPSATSWTGYTPSTSRPNTKFCIQEADMTPATVTLMDNGATITEVSAGAGVTLPSRAGCTGYTFAGWTKTWVAPQSSWTTTAPTIIPAGSYTPSANENLYPVYTKTEGGGSPEFSQYQQVALGGTITAGKYLISTGSYTMAGNGKTGVSLTPGTTEAAAREYTVAIVSGTTITIKGPDNKYIGGLDKADGLTFSTTTPSSDDYRWVYTENGIQNKSITGRHIKAYSTTDFRHYGTGNGTLTYFYKRIETSGSTTSYISVPNCCTDPGLNYATGSVTKTYGASAFTNTLTNSHGVAVTYSSSDPTVATVNGSGQVTILKVGSTTITASSIAQTVSTVDYCADEASYTLTVNKASISPSLSYSSTTLVIGNNSSSPMVGGNSGSGTVTYAITTESTSGVVTLNTSTGVVTAAKEGTATITATIPATTNYNGGSATANFTVTCGAPSSVDIDGDYQFYPGETISLTATPTGGAGTPVTYQWKKDGVNIVGATSATYTKNNATVADAGSYTCTVQYGSNCATTSSAFKLKCMQFYLKTSGGADISNHALTKVDATHATLSLSLTGGTTYKFRVTDGCGDWYGNNGEMTSINCTNWPMDADNDCRITTSSKSATYTFNFDFSGGLLGSEMRVSVVYPSSNQASGKVIYWDNEVNKWNGSKLWYRIGKSTHNSNTQLSKVAGTANFYSVTTSQYDGFEYWHIANNVGQGTGNVYWTKDNSSSGLEITHAMGFEGAPITDATATVTPTTTHSTGGSSDNNNCEFYTYSITSGIKSYTVTSSATNCTVAMEKYNNDAGSSTTALASGGTVMPTQYVKVTVTPNTGYQFSSVSVTNGTTVTAAAAGTPGVYYITGNATVTATCTVKSCTVNFDKNSGTGGDASTTATYGSAMTTVTAPTRTGYTFDGYWDAETDNDGSGTQYYLANGTSARDWDKDVTAAQTLYAKWNAKQYTIELDREGAASGATSVTATFDAGTLAGWSAPSKEGYTFGGYWSGDNGTGTLVISTTGVLQNSVTISAVAWTDGSGHWVKDGGADLYAKWTAEQYTITYKDQGGGAYSGSNGGLLPTTHTYGVATALVDGVKDGYRFDGWFTDASCTVSAGSSIGATAKTADFMLYAKWTQVYTVTWYVNGDEWESGVVSGNTQVPSGTKVSALPTAPTSSDCDDSKVFVGWKAAEIDGTSAGDPGGIFTTQGTSPTINANMDFYAVFADESGGDNTLVTNVSELTNGTQVYMYAEFVASETTYGAVAKAYGTGNNVRATSGSVSGTKLTPGENACAYTIGTTTGTYAGYTFYDGSKYLQASSTTNNYMVGVEDISDNGYCEFSITITDGVCAIASTGNTSRGVMQFNKNNDTGDYTSALFSCYQKEDNTNRSNVKLYKKNPYVYSNYVTTCASCDADATYTNTTPTVSEIGCTTATLTMEDGLATLGAAGCNISDYGFVIGTSDNPAIGGSGVTKLQVGTTNPTTGEDFSYDATDLTKGTHYYIRAYAKNGHGTAYSSSQNFWTKEVSSIAITTAPTKTNYIVGETFDATGMVVTATLASSATEDVTSDVTYSSSALTAGTSQNFAINYTRCETAKSVNQVINVYTLTVTEGANPSYGTATNSSANIVSITGLGDHKTYTVTVTSSNATAVDNGDNTWSIINPTGNVTVRVDYADAVQVKVYYKVDGVTVTGLTQDVYQSETTTLPTASELATAMAAQSMDIPDDDYPNFYGWSETEFPAQTAEPSLVTGTPTINAEKTYYAVYTNINKKSITPSAFSGTYASNDGENTIDGVKYEVSNICTQSSKIQFRSSPGYLYSKGALAYIKKIEITGLDLIVNACSDNAGTLDGDAITPTGTAPYVYTFPASKQYFKIKGKGGTDKVSLIEIFYANTTVYYMTEFCAKKVTLSHNSPEHGTVEFSRSSLATCGSDKNVSLTITPDAGYKLTGWTVNTASGYADAKTTSPAVVTTNNNSAAQNITLTFAQDANKNYDVTATFGLMTVESWTWTHNSAAIPDPLNLYVGQSARLDVAYTPAGVDASKKTYTRTKVDAYINWSGAAQATYSTISGRASTGENTTEVTFIHADGPTTTVNVKVLPLPLVHFADIVHNVSFDDVVATLSDNTLSPTKTTPTHADFDGATKNTCEEQHLHLVGWIREDWPSLVTYLNGGAQPSTDDITGAGNDASGNAYFFAPGASINTQTFNGVTFYAVWAKVE